MDEDSDEEENDGVTGSIYERTQGFTSGDALITQLDEEVDEVTDSAGKRGQATGAIRKKRKRKDVATMSSSSSTSEGNTTSKIAENLPQNAKARRSRYGSTGNPSITGLIVGLWMILKSPRVQLKPPRLCQAMQMQMMETAMIFWMI